MVHASYVPFPHSTTPFVPLGQTVPATFLTTRTPRHPLFSSPPPLYDNRQPVPQQLTFPCGQSHVPPPCISPIHPYINYIVNLPFPRSSSEHLPDLPRSSRISYTTLPPSNTLRGTRLRPWFFPVSPLHPFEQAVPSLALFPFPRARAV